MKTVIFMCAGLFLFIWLVSKLADYEVIRSQSAIIEAYDGIIKEMDDDYFLDVVSETDYWNEIQYYKEKLETR